MKIQEDYKAWVIQELIDWAETFNTKYPNSMEEVIEQENLAYENIHKLIDKLKKDSFSKQDYEDIIFHVWQKSHFEIEV